MDDDKFTALNIVNQLGDLWNVPVDVRQATNDEADAFVLKLIRKLIDEPYNVGKLPGYI